MDKYQEEIRVILITSWDMCVLYYLGMLLVDNFSLEETLLIGPICVLLH